MTKLDTYHALDAIIKNDELYVADGYGGLKIFNIEGNKITNPELIKSINTNGYAYTLDTNTDNTKIYLSNYNNQILEIDKNTKKIIKKENIGDEGKKRKIK